MIISQADRFSIQLIQVWCFYNWIPMATKIPIALIICHDQYNIWPIGKYKDRN